MGDASLDAILSSRSSFLERFSDCGLSIILLNNNITMTLDCDFIYQFLMAGFVLFPSERFWIESMYTKDSR